jgi:hypothetical protein
LFDILPSGEKRKLYKCTESVYLADHFAEREDAFIRAIDYGREALCELCVLFLLGGGTIIGANAVVVNIDVPLPEVLDVGHFELRVCL